MITLNEIAYNIQNIMYPNTLTIEGQIPLRQIKHWIHYHRAKLIKDNIDKGILSYKSLYQTFLGDETEVSDGGGTVYNDWYGNTVGTPQNKGDFRNLGRIVLEIPRPIMLSDSGGIKSVSLARVVYDENNDEAANYVSKQMSIPFKTKSEREYGDYNKFTNNTKPFYTILNSTSDSARLMAVWALQRAPDYFGDLTTPVAEDISFRYIPKIEIISENPTDSTDDFLHSTDDGEFNDDKTPYPIPAQYLNDLIQRIVQSEISTSLKIMESES